MQFADNRDRFSGGRPSRGGGERWNGGNRGHGGERGNGGNRGQGGGRGNSGKPWWCSAWPRACSGATNPGQGTDRPWTPTNPKPNNPQTSNPPRPTVRPPTTTKRPATTRNPGAPSPAATQSTKPAPDSPHVTSAAPRPTKTEQPTTETTRFPPVVVQPDDDKSRSGTGAGNTGVGGSSPTGGSKNGNSGSKTEDVPAHTGLPSITDPSSLDGSDSGGIGNASGGGLPPGAIAGIVVGLLVFLALLAVLLYRFRKTPAMQRMLASFSRFPGGSAGFRRVETPGPDTLSRNPPSPAIGEGMAAAAGGTGAAAAAAASHSRSPTGSGWSQPPMRQTNRLHPFSVSVAAATRDSNPVSVFTYDSAASSAFTPSPVTPTQPGMVSPGAVWTSRPVEEPPDPRIVAAATGHITRGSISSISTGSAISAALSPGQMAWPMPPGTPPAIRHPDGPQYVTFKESGETVVRINQPSSRSILRSPGY
ncbi:hypothetical protein C7999DRAFT_42557 [Corynascus novoguineensis]|uniref:Uncharacterized protein n=1 Tax=Corynascus novoguineensis TaxID=1126955 RepID=A0AAN7CRJ9_9PEZI|nr:hypothetical protein C7999DRAFT_42557 [Corynascus novoguineensis]